MSKSEPLLASVIVPVYNKETFLEDCVKSLSKQTLDCSQFEAIFIDDGSSDGSLETLKSLAEKHKWMHILAQPNGGVCSARNAGISAAKGKYLFYLDPDDEFSPNTISTVSEFFDHHKDEIDIVTYKIIEHSNGKAKPLHYRYEILDVSGVYDLRDGDNWLICQTTMNICVKNKFENNHTFSFKTDNGIIFHEDQQYITEILRDKPKIGYCSEPKYIWNKNIDSVTNNILKPYHIFNNTMTMFETLFSPYEGNPPRYVQGLFINDIAWKMRSDAALPNHLAGKQHDLAMDRFKALLNQIEDSTILKHPSLHQYHRYYFLAMKDAPEISLEYGPDGIAAMRENVFLFSQKKFELFILRTRITKHKLYLFGTLKSPFFLLSNKIPTFFAETQNSEGFKKTNIELSESSLSRCGSSEITAKFFNFKYETNLNNESKTTFKVEFAGHTYDTYLTCQELHCNFSKNLNNIAYDGNTKISLEKSRGIINVSAERTRTSQKAPGQTTVRLVRKVALRLQKNNEANGTEVWLYSDAAGRLDNAWDQFLHDANKEDGVKRYYVANCVQPNGFISKRNAQIIKVNSRQHKILFLIADKILASDIARSTYIPWGDKAILNYVDILNPELIYLQHGVLWAHMPRYYSYDRVLFDREVVSTTFEMSNLTANYGFQESDLIPCGMPRYDFIDKNQQPLKKILLCPSWRQYLIGDLKNNKRQAFPEKFKSSDYFKNISTLLSDDNLLHLLEKHGYSIELKLHPNFSCYKKFFEAIESDNFKLARKDTLDSEYSVIITDYSSYSFDFVYLSRPIIYFIPDETLFYAGIGHYNRLDISLNEAYGEYAHNAKELVDALERVLEHDCKPLPKYQEKYRALFLYQDKSNRERLYKSLMGK